MVASKKEKSIWVPHFEGPQVQHTLVKRYESLHKQCGSKTYLNTEVTPIHVVTQEEVSRIGRAPTDFKELHKVVLLRAR